MTNQNILVITVLVAYFVLLMVTSRLTVKKGGKNEDFFMANRRAPWWVVSVGMIGASVSGVSFISVPGMVRDIGFQYMQTVFGFLLGYILIAQILLPVYYRLSSASIYEYLLKRFGVYAYKTGAAIFLVSKLFGTAAKVYVIVVVLQSLAFDAVGLPFYVSVAIILLMIWLYTYRGGLRTIVWTDMLQTVFMVLALVMIIFSFMGQLHLDTSGLTALAFHSDWSKWVEFGDWSSKQYFFKQFFSGAFIALVMTGLDQDMIQKNRAIRTLRQSQKNMYCYGASFIPLNFMFLLLGVLMLQFAAVNGITLPERADEYLPFFVSGNYFGVVVSICFVVGVVAATFSSADSSLTALTTSFCVDIAENESNVKLRKWSHIVFCVLMFGVISSFQAFRDKSLIDMIYTIVSYTYGPLLGLFSFGLVCKRQPRGWLVPLVAVLSPAACYFVDNYCASRWNYHFGYELLLLNGALTFVGLFVASLRQKSVVTNI